MTTRVTEPPQAATKSRVLSQTPVPKSSDRRAASVPPRADPNPTTFSTFVKWPTWSLRYLVASLPSFTRTHDQAAQSPSDCSPVLRRVSLSDDLLYSACIARDISCPDSPGLTIKTSGDWARPHSFIWLRCRLVVTSKNTTGVTART